ncbi:glycosyltransferase [Maridesulfovibrio ferrireducens]|uniref:glycosyltransferase family 2 protein n=1 Tax=Maridesulfovibrio ferrireducens TaxID=246191 RepID=UPI001A336B53|nr:glycosyltransferase [Maridesulfovibrio ferrireducens]MBI9113072.1 glycosyltransferase [Maridesulfovibrio ferrireducens]
MKEFYFSEFEHRTPYKPVPFSGGRQFLYQYLATINIAMGVWYFHWRWFYSLNTEALWFSIPLALAETLAFLSTTLFIINLWAYRDETPKAPPSTVNDILLEKDKQPVDRPIIVDLFLPTYTEDPELVRYSIRDSKAITYPYPADIRIHILDDGKRDEMRQVAEEEGLNYITRDDNRGFKAGNLRNAMEQTSGDIIVILDADTRPFPQFLERTLGYFKDPDVAWVQTPQWFYDIPAGTTLEKWLGKKIGRLGSFFGRMIEKVVGPINIGRDIFGSDPRMFYDCILRKRMNFNASFCCGAGSLHRREAVQRAALIRYAEEIERHADHATRDTADPELAEAMRFGAIRGFMSETEVTPYKYHVSEDIYTSMLLHADRSRRWKSIHHAEVLSKMLAPQDIESYLTQNFKYSSGTLDLLRRDNPVSLPGLSKGQRLMYFSSTFSYFAAFWMVIFLITPPIFYFTNIVPVDGFNLDFFIHILSFQLISQITFMFGTWGVNTLRNVQYYIAFFPLNIRAIWTVLKGSTIKFKVTPKRGESRARLDLVRPQIFIIALNFAGIFWYIGRIFLGYEYDLLGFIIATFWSLLNMSSLFVIIRAATWNSRSNQLK